MAFITTPIQGQPTRVEESALLGLMLQNPADMVQAASLVPASDPGAEVLATQISFAQPWLISFTMHGAETDGHTHSVDLLVAPWNFRVVLFWATLSDLTGTVNASDTIQLKNDTTAITDAITLNVGDSELTGLVADTSIIDEASGAGLVVAASTLKAELVLADSTDHNVAVCGHILCARYLG